MSIKVRANRKGQTLAPDFVASLAMFLVLIVGSAIIWNTTVTRFSQLRENQFMQEKVFSITDALVRTAGYPAGWNSTYVKVVGLSEGGSSHILNPARLVEFKNMDQDLVKSVWGIGGYEYHINITDSSNNVVILKDGTSLEYGTVPANKKDLVPLKRLVLINESGTLTRATMTFMIWR